MSLRKRAFEHQTHLVLEWGQSGLFPQNVIQKEEASKYPLGMDVPMLLLLDQGQDSYWDNYRWRGNTPAPWYFGDSPNKPIPQESLQPSGRRNSLRLSLNLYAFQNTEKVKHSGSTTTYWEWAHLFQNMGPKRGSSIFAFVAFASSVKSKKVIAKNEVKELNPYVFS